MSSEWLASVHADYRGAQSADLSGGDRRCRRRRARGSGSAIRSGGEPCGGRCGADRLRQPVGHRAVGAAGGGGFGEGERGEPTSTTIVASSTGTVSIKNRRGWVVIAELLKCRAWATDTPSGEIVANAGRSTQRERRQRGGPRAIAQGRPRAGATHCGVACRAWPIRFDGCPASRARHRSIHCIACGTPRDVFQRVPSI